MDITFEDLKAYVAAHKNFGYKIDTSNSSDQDAPNVIGIYKGRHAWHWFKRWKDGTYDFDHTYSQNTGATHSGINHMLSVTRAIHSFLNKDK